MLFNDTICFFICQYLWLESDHMFLYNSIIPPDCLHFLIFFNRIYIISYTFSQSKGGFKNNRSLNSYTLMLRQIAHRFILCLLSRILENEHPTTILSIYETVLIFNSNKEEYCFIYTLSLVLKSFVKF